MRLLQNFVDFLSTSQFDMGWKSQRSYNLSLQFVGTRVIQFVGNEAKGRIWKRVSQENKAHQIFWKKKKKKKKNISYPLIRTRTYVCVSEGKKFLFFRKFGGLVFF